jgi:hypothetical protein
MFFWDTTEEVFLRCGIQRRTILGWQTNFFYCVTDAGNFSSVVSFFYNVFQLPKWTPPTPVQASQARWMGVRIHVLLLGIIR